MNLNLFDFDKKWNRLDGKKTICLFICIIFLFILDNEAMQSGVKQSSIAKIHFNDKSLFERVGIIYFLIIYS